MDEEKKERKYVSEKKRGGIKYEKQKDTEKKLWKWESKKKIG